MDSKILKQLQETELGMLKDLDAYFAGNNIRYSLYGGTLLGAVRHKGFIPWDDDIDIVMTREEFSKFREAWQTHPLPGYYLENYETDDFTQNTHTKIRKDGTTLVSDVEDETKGHHGIWIDIFILDKVSLDTEEENQMMRTGRKLILLVKANGTLPGESIPKRIARTVLKIAYPERKRKKELKYISEFLKSRDRGITDNYQWCDMCTLDYLKIRFPKETGREYDVLQFEGCEFSVYANYDELLHIMYGDYMKLPPLEERVCKHNPAKISFG